MAVPVDQHIPEPGAADYRAMGLRCGLEVHYQLDTRKKLFCRCPVGLRNDPPDAEIVRHMRPTLSELGEYDGTALMEFKTRKEVHYQLHYDTVCTYEMDDTPPFLLNQEALDIALEIALLLNCQVVDEIHVSRKQYLDGSIPTGFQRTIAVGVDGWIPFRGRKIRVLQLCLEEDACREVSDRGHVIVLRTDRLSTPLVEVITEAGMTTPEEAAAVNREIGRILRATGKVRRGIGTVRQDVNVSVEGGVRAEIKGVPRTGLLLRLVHYEAVRQSALLSLKRELLERGITRRSMSAESALCTDVFRGTRVRAVAEALARGEAVGVVKLGGFTGLLVRPLGPGRTFAEELRGRVRVIACLDRQPILLHDDRCRAGRRSNDAPGSPSPEEWRQVRKLLDAGPGDAVVVVWGPERDARTALGEIIDRAAEALEGVPRETRQALKSGETDFERILPGPDRMYPDTDSAPLPVEQERLERIRKSLPVAPSAWRDRYQVQAGGELVDQLIDRDLIRVFDHVIERSGADPRLAAVTLLNARKTVLKKRGTTEKAAPFTREQIEALISILEAHRRGEVMRKEILELFSRVPAGGDTGRVLENRGERAAEEGRGGRGS